MIKIKPSISIINTMTILLLCMGCGLGYGKQINAQNLNTASIKFQPPPPPPNSGEPTGRAQGGAGRGCEPTALVPITKSEQGNILWGLTVAERPQFWFSLPRDLTTKDAIEFVLKDHQGKEVYQTMIKNTKLGQGIVSFSIPQQIPSLEIGKSYIWSFSVYCDFQNVEDKPGNVRGTIERIAKSPNLINQLSKATTPVQQAKIYAQNGIWFDTLTTLAVTMRNHQEKDISSTWIQLLKQVNLEKNILLPITDCCIPAKK